MNTQSSQKTFIIDRKPLIMNDSLNTKIETIYKAESNRVLASLIRILNDLDLAEEALQDAMYAALKQWPQEGVPDNPYSWLVSAGKFKAIDSVRRNQRGIALLSKSLSHNDFKDSYSMPLIMERHYVEDDQLRLIFYCCHPSLPLDARIALSLREVCGLSTDQISRAFLVSYETIKKRITRAKALIKDKNIPYEIPCKLELTKRVNAVLHVIYLIFNEGYSASSGESHIRRDLSEQAIFLSRNLVKLNASPESLGLLALLLLQESRRASRVTKNGDIISLEEQDRSQWNKQMIREGVDLLHQAIMSGKLGPYSLQAAIASVHALSDSVENTQWQLIVGYYDMLLSINISPVIELNRAIAVGMHDGPAAGLAIIEQLITNKKLLSYPTIYAAKAEFSKKLGLKNQAIEAYQQAINSAQQIPERKYLQKQMSELTG